MALTARFYGPQGIAADGAGLLYVADTANSTIRKVTPAGAVSTFAGAPGNFNSFDGAGANAQFYQPEGVAVDAGGNLYVADTWNHTIRKITPAGLVSTLAGSGRESRRRGRHQQQSPLLSACGHRRGQRHQSLRGGHVQSHDAQDHARRHGNHHRRSPGVWGSADGTNSAARFYLPQGISVAANGDLFVADSGNQTLRKVSPAGTNWVVSTVAGLTGLAGSTNGTGDSARFYFPAGLALDSAGYLYVADAANNTHSHDACRAAYAAIHHPGQSSRPFLADVSRGICVGAIRRPGRRRSLVAGDQRHRHPRGQLRPHQHLKRPRLLSPPLSLSAALANGSSLCFFNYCVTMVPAPMSPGNRTH